MSYKNDSLMDCGYFMGGHPDGLIHFPVDKNETPSIIPWSELLDWAESIDENEESATQIENPQIDEKESYD